MEDPPVDFVVVPRVAVVIRLEPAYGSGVLHGQMALGQVLVILDF